MSDRPNIVLAVCDYLSTRALRLHLGDLPTLRMLLNGARSFTNAYACCPEISPSRASLFTGPDVAVHGLWTDGMTPAKRETPMPEDLPPKGIRRGASGTGSWPAFPIEHRTRAPA